MALYRFEVKTISRSEGRSAVGAAAYRNGSLMRDHESGDTFDYRRRAKLGPSFIVVNGRVVGTSHQGRSSGLQSEALWNAADRAERRKNSTVARELVVALPHELDEKAHMRMIRATVEELTRTHGFAAEISIHPPSPGADADKRNVHFHALLTTRKVESIAGGQVKLGAKTRELDDRATGPGLVTAWREIWERNLNAELAKANVAQVSCRSYAERGIDRVPGRHRGPAGTAWHRKQLRLEREALAARTASRTPVGPRPAPATTLAAEAARPAPKKAREPIGPLPRMDSFARAVTDPAESRLIIRLLADEERGPLWQNAVRAWMKQRGRLEEEWQRLQVWWRTVMTPAQRDKAVAWSKTPVPAPTPPSRGEGPAQKPGSPPARANKPDLPGR